MMANKWSVWVAVLVLAALAGLSAWYGLTRQGQAGLGRVPAPQKPSDDDGIINYGGKSSLEVDGGIALRYAEAVQDSNCSELVGLTWWMQERLLEVAQQDPSRRNAEIERLCVLATERKVERGRLMDEGVGDQYVFGPGATIAAYAQDEGRDDLEKPVSHRIWLKVTYPTQLRALCDRDGRPIKSIVTGVNVSNDGYILKANVEGNLDFDWQSITYGW